MPNSALTQVENMKHQEDLEYVQIVLQDHIILTMEVLDQNHV